MLRVTYYYSACVAISGNASSVLCDPWFTDGAYDGSWFQYPRLKDPLRKIGRHSHIYISHIHPDHLDLAFLGKYCRRYPATQLLIANFKRNYLAKKLQEAGLPFQVVDEIDLGEFKVRIIPNEQGNVFDVDSALVVRDPGGQVVVNVNDNDFHADMVGQIRDYGGPNPEIALLGYTGAGPYPQTYYDDPCVLMQRAAEKKLEFFRRYRIMRDAINPKVAVPFAGKYWLGGKLVDLKAFRGVADAVEVLEFDDRAVVLADGGAASIDTATLQPTAVRTQGYEPESIKAFLESIRSAPMDYERNFRSLSTQRVPYRSLLLRSYENALKRSMCQSDYYLGVVLSDCVFVCNANANNSQYWFRTDMVGLEPRSEVRVDLRYLFGLITRVYHWNNAEIGSHLTVQRVPDVFDRTAQHFLDFFYV